MGDIVAASKEMWFLIGCTVGDLEGNDVHVEVWIPEGDVGGCAECFRTEREISQVVVDRGTSQTRQAL